ncbi:uncharacterized protein WM294_007423 [Sarcoramphus papa]
MPCRNHLCSFSGSAEVIRRWNWNKSSNTESPFPGVGRCFSCTPEHHPAWLGHMGSKGQPGLTTPGWAPHRCNPKVKAPAMQQGLANCPGVSSGTGMCWYGDPGQWFAARGSGLCCSIPEPCPLPAPGTQHRSCASTMGSSPRQFSPSLTLVMQTTQTSPHQTDCDSAGMREMENCVTTSGVASGTRSKSGLLLLHRTIKALFPPGSLPALERQEKKVWGCSPGRRHHPAGNLARW